MAETDQKLLTVRIGESLLAKFRTATGSQGITMAQVVRDNILAWLEKNPASKAAAKKKKAERKAELKKADAKKAAGKKVASKKLGAKDPEKGQKKKKK